MAERIKLIRLIPVLDFGGVETVFELWSQVIDRERYDVRICTFWKAGAAADAIRKAGIPVDVLNVDPSIRNPRASWTLARYLRHVRPDILQASIGEANFHAALVGKMCGVPIVMIEEHGIPNRPLPYRLVHAVLYRMVDAVIGVSQVALDYVVKREYAPRARTRLLYNAIADQYFAPIQPPPQKHGADFQFVTVGRLHPVKNQQRLIQAFAEVARLYPNVSLTIVGGGDMHAELECLISDLRLTKRVTLAGYRGDVKAIVENADCFLFPSLTEAFGIGAVEAMARGLPTIASSGGALPEIVGDLGPEWIIDPYDIKGWSRAMQAMVTLDEDARARLGRQSRQIAERYTLTRHAAALDDIYIAMLAEKGFCAQA